MSRAFSIHIGVNHPRHLAHARVSLYSEQTAGEMAQLAHQAGYDSVLMLRGRAATLKAVRDALARASDDLVCGDTLFVSFAGHGGKVYDCSHDERCDRGEAHDETWCLADDMLLDDHLLELWRGFKRGVRIVVVSESCYSAGMRRTATGYEYLPRPAVQKAFAPGFSGFGSRADAASPSPGRPFANGQPEGAYRGGRGGPVLRDGGAARAAVRDAAQVQLSGMQSGAEPRPSCIPEAPSTTDGIQASVLMLTSAGEDQEATDGVFSHALLKLWADGACGSYCDLYWKLRDHAMRETGQETHICMLGGPDLKFPMLPAFRPVPFMVMRGG